MKSRTSFNLLVISSLVFGLMLFSAPGSSYAQQSPLELVWNATYDGGQEDGTSQVIADGSGNVYITGNSHNGTNNDLRTIKYDNQGTVQWNLTYDDGGDEYGVNVATDSAGNVYVSAVSYKGGPDSQLLLKYNNAGVLQWIANYDSGGNEMVTGAVPDEAGNVYAAGTQPWGNRYLIKYDSAGNVLWTKTDTQTGCNRNGDIARDPQGNLYITGYTCDAFRTTKYDSNGNVIWNQIYNPGVFDYSNDLALDDAGNVYVSGWSGDNWSYFEAVTLKYDNAGNFQWDRRYNAGAFAVPGGMDADGAGNVYVGASKRNSVQGADLDIRVIKYDTAGTLQWDLPYDSPTNEGAHGVAVNPNGSQVYVAGTSFNGANDDWRTIKYSSPSPTTRLVATTESTAPYPGDPISVELTLEEANDLYAAQATCTVDPALLQPQSGSFGNFFDSVNNLIGMNNADAAAGTWTGAISHRSPAEPLSGNGLFATIVYQAQSPGTTSITCDPLLSDQNGFAQPVTFTGTEITVLPFATANGLVTYQGRLDHADITLTATGPIVRTVTTDSTGNFELELKAGDYTLVASAEGYLSKSTMVTVTSGQSVTLPSTILQGGSVNGDDVIDIGDATLVAANFGLTVPPGDARADINDDGIVNVQDLAILGSNYGLSGNQAW